MPVSASAVWITRRHRHLIGLTAAPPARRDQVGMARAVRAAKGR
jgi:hypothetical protein